MMVNEDKMDEEGKEDREEKVLSTLETCFPVTQKTGELDDDEVDQILHLKYIPQHTIKGVVFNQVYQGRTDDLVVDMLNPN